MFYKSKIIFLLFSFSSCLIGQSKYSVDSNGTVELIKEHQYTKNHFFRNYIIDATFVDNLGNYGSNDVAVIAEYKNGTVSNLQWSSKLIYQNNKIIYAKGVRKKGEDEAGVGKLVLFAGEKPLNILNDIECDYAIKFFKNKSFTKFNCYIKNKNLNILQNLNQTHYQK